MTDSIPSCQVWTLVPTNPPRELYEICKYVWHSLFATSEESGSIFMVELFWSENDVTWNEYIAFQGVCLHWVALSSNKDQREFLLSPQFNSTLAIRISFSNNTKESEQFPILIYQYTQRAIRVENKTMSRAP